MLSEDYVSYETAKLLKKKGFDEATIGYYYTISEIPEKIKFFDSPISIYDSEGLIGCIQAPTLQMAMKWLREVHNKIIVPNISLDDRTSSTINHYIVGIWHVPKNNGGAFCYTSPTPYNGYPSFEEACEAAIKYCLENLI